MSEPMTPERGCDQCEWPWGELKQCPGCNQLFCGEHIDPDAHECGAEGPFEDPSW